MLLSFTNYVETNLHIFAKYWNYISFIGNRTINNTANNIFGSTIKNNNFAENAEGGRGEMERELNDLIEKKKNVSLKQLP